MATKESRKVTRQVKSGATIGKANLPIASKEVEHSLKIELRWFILSLVVGYFFAADCVGSGYINNISNISYLYQDTLQNFLGWHLFRYDSWHWPLTVTDRILYPQHISIVYSDSVPILSLFFKLMSPLLPKIFIFQGVELVINCTLQFYFAALIFRILNNDRWIVIIGALFCLFSPVLIQRMGMPGAVHDTLTAQWLILAAIVLYLKPSHPHWFANCKLWLILIFLAIGIHAYIYFMVFCIFMAWLYKSKYENTLTLKELSISFACVLLTSFLSYYFFGYYVVNDSVEGGGFGSYSMNLLAIFNPKSSWFLDPNTVFSPFLPDIMQPEMQHEGFQYLGFGVILSALAAIYIMITTLSIKKIKQFFCSGHLALFLICGFLFLYALSSKVMIGNDVLFDITPYFEGNWLLKKLTVFRASGRLFWPVYYLIFILAILTCYNYFSQKSKILARVILSVLLVFQFIDIQQMATNLSNYIDEQLQRGSWNDEFKDSFWYNLQSYKHLYVLTYNLPPQSNFGPPYFRLGMIAAINGLTTNKFYLARGDSQKNIMSNIDYFMRGQLINSDSVYILDNQELSALAPQYLAMLDCRVIDNYIVCVKNN